MSEHTTNRAHDLVEDLRADVDFELDDVIANIVRDLPEEYFQRLKRKDQLTHLKALLAINVCQLEHEIIMRSSDGRHVAVVAKQNYPGLLANILKRLPDDQPLIGAKIFTSKTHEFIIDLFEFGLAQTDDDSDLVEPFEVENTVNEVARGTGASIDTISKFVSAYPMESQVLRSPDDIYEHFLAFQDINADTPFSVRLAKSNPESPRITIAASTLTAREVFQQSAEYFGKQSLDIEQAFLNDLDDGQQKIAISSFVLSGSFSDSQVDAISKQLMAKDDNA